MKNMPTKAVHAKANVRRANSIRTPMAASLSQSPRGEVTDETKVGEGASTSDTLGAEVDALVASLSAEAWTGRLADEVGEEMSGS